MYVSAEGELEVIQGDRVLGRMGPGKAFGELAILYNCTRTASIKGTIHILTYPTKKNKFTFHFLFFFTRQKKKNTIHFIFFFAISFLSDVSKPSLSSYSENRQVVIDFSFPSLFRRRNFCIQHIEKETH